MRTRGLRVLITGGGSGIGLAVAHRLAADNTVIIAGRDGRKLAVATEKAPRLQALALDVTSEDQVAEAFDRISREFGGLDLIVHAAGVMHGFRIADEGAAALIEAEVEINLVGATRVVRLGLPILRRSETPGVVLISSSLALAPAPGLAVYSATKAALHSLARSWRTELASEGIRVFDVLPTWVDTNLSSDLAVAKITPDGVAAAIIDGVARDRHQILIGRAWGVALASRISPRLAEALVARASRAPSGGRA
jgi:short-subunit dehydrogenase involved in D-alanine esterification of teichoic acids